MGGAGKGQNGWYAALDLLVDEVVFVHRDDRSIAFVSPSVEQVLGYTPEQFEALSTPELIHPDDLAAAAETAVWLRAEHGRSYRSTLRVRHHDRRWIWVEIVGRNLLQDPDVAGVVNTLRDVSEQRAQEERLAELAHHDALTGLANRSRLLERLGEALAGPAPTGTGVLYLDLDGFKAVNDAEGHAVGDQLLQVVAERLRGVVRDRDLAGRLGGDELLVVCCELETDAELAGVADRVHQAVRGPASLGPTQLDVRVSVGAAHARDDDGPEDVVAAADAALYEAKRAGGDQVRLAARRS